MGFNSVFKGLISALDGGGWPTPRPGHCTPGKELWLVSIEQEGWMGHGARLDVFENRKNVLPLPGFESRTVQPVN